MNITQPPRTPLFGLWGARVAFVASQRPTHALSVSFNDPTSTNRVRHGVRLLHAMVDRALLGRRFNRRAASERTWFAAFVENAGSNAHLHLAVRPPAGRADAFAALFAARPSPWERIALRASHELKPLTDAAGWIAYSTKDLTARGEWFISSEFLPADIEAA